MAFEQNATSAPSVHRARCIAAWSANLPVHCTHLNWLTPRAASQKKGSASSQPSAAGSVGPITTSDVERASMAGQVLYGFDTVAARGVHAEAKSLGVDIKMHSVIYDLMIELREHLSEFLPAEYVCSEVQCVQ